MRYFPIPSGIQSNPWLFTRLIWELCDILPSRRTKEAEHTTWQSFKTKKEFLDHLHFYWSSLATDIVSNKIIFCNFFIYFLFLFLRHALRLACLQAQITRQTCFQLYPSLLKWEQNIARINGVWQSDPTGPSFSSGGKVSYTETLMLLIFNLAWRSYFIVCCVSHLIPTKFSL